MVLWNLIKIYSDIEIVTYCDMSDSFLKILRYLNLKTILLHIEVEYKG